MSRSLKWIEDPGEENFVVNVYPEIEYQTFEGFGGALTDAAGATYALMSDKQKQEMINIYFKEDDMGYNRVRIHMDSCDFSTHLYEADSDPDDIDFSKFSFTDTEKYIIPLLNDAQKAAGKKLKIMLSAWSPPAYMKTNGERKHGGSLKKEYRDRWAEYICRYIKEFIARGYDVERISIQNEPKAVQTWDSCVYTAQEEKEFLRDHLYPAMVKNGLEKVEIFIWDHNKERVYERVKEIVDETTEKMVSGAAFHWYSGDHFEALSLVRQRYPKLKLILSESCLEFSKFDAEKEQENGLRLAHDMIGNLNNGMNSFYDWNILLDEKGGPNHVGNFCDAPFLFDRDNKELMYRATIDYYRSFAGNIKPGAIRVASTSYSDKVDTTAWKNPDGKLVCLMLNKNNEKCECNVRVNGKLATLELEPYELVAVDI